MRRALPLVLLALLAVAAGPGDAEARCPIGTTCRTVSVPLDRSGAVEGTVRLSLARRRARDRSRRPPVIALSGGPGQAARDEIYGFDYDLGPRVLRERDLIAFDARGTGHSGVIRCPEMQRAAVPRDTAAAEACARRLGERRRFYSTIDQAEDIEAVRAALRLPKVALYGISYGTRVALTYARLHPDRVDRLVLDSVAPAEGASALSQEILGAMPRVLGRRLPKITALVDRLRAAPLTGTAFDGRGRARPTRATPAAVFDVLLAADFNLPLRQALPAAADAAEAGDPAALLRLVRAARQGERLPSDPAEFSAGLYAATSCEELAFPWAPTAGFEERVQRAREAAAQAPARAPFAAEDILTLDWISLCLRWPVTPGPRPLPETVADVPALILSGETDLRTPLEDARRVAAQLPRARLLSVPGAGHAVIGGDPTGCARRAARAFLRGRQVPRRCPRARTGYERGVPVPPRSLASLKPEAVGGRAGRTLAALTRTLDDAELALTLSAGGDRTGGLRGGSARFRPRGLPRLRAYEYVPGVEVTVGARRIRITGRAAARGTLARLEGGRLRGRLGGRRIDVRLR